MASLPPSQVEDTDEDFFDKLVNDEVDFTASKAKILDRNDSEEAKAFANLSINEVFQSEDDPFSGFDFKVDDNNGSVDDIALISKNDANDNSVDSESGKGVGKFDASGNNSVASRISVKEVDWSVFNSEAHVHNAGGFGSYSDFLTELEDNSGAPIGSVADKGSLGAELNISDSVSESPVVDSRSLSYGEHQEGVYNGQSVGQTTDGQELSSTQNWDSLYPGWRYDPSTGEWHQVNNHDANLNVNVSMNASTNSHGGYNANVPTDDGIVTMDQNSDIYHYHQSVQSDSGITAESESVTTSSESNRNQVRQGIAEYPAHMVFDPQYPGWYYDIICQEWKSLESYTTTTSQPISMNYNQQNQMSNVSLGEVSPQDSYNANKLEQVKNSGVHDLSFQDQVVDWVGSTNTYSHGNVQMWQPEPVAKTEAVSFTEKQQYGNLYGVEGHVNNSTYQHMGFNSSQANSVHEKTTQVFDATYGAVGFQGLTPSGNFSQHHNQAIMEPSQQLHLPPAYFDCQNSVSFSKQTYQSGIQFSHTPNEGRSSAGRPPHALVTFGFGGKLIVMKEYNSLSRNVVSGSQDVEVGALNVLNLMEVVMDKTESMSNGIGNYNYFHALCKQSYPGPLVGGSINTKELQKWIDDKITNSAYPSVDYRKGEISRMLFALLKVACQYYGKLRSPLASDQALKENSPESAVANLFASTKRKGASLSGCGSLTHCLQNLASEGQTQATALEVEKLLVTGRKKEALECAQQGQLWGLALVLASQLGDQFYRESVRQMALSQLVAGSPLRTLCLLIAGKPVDVFPDSTNGNNLPSAVSLSQQPMQIGSQTMLDEWEENLAIITANRTKDDELVIIHLGDCLWKERGEVTAAHICYLVAEANFESYSDSARLCLVGADHWRSPRTYASPEAIQMTELYEYSKVLGNSQFILFPLQPYKFIHALMLAEVGKLSDSLKYCQAISKSLKTGRGPEVDTWKQLVSSLEERIRTHQQGGYGTNIAPTKLVGKLLNLFDSTAHRVVGDLPPPVPSSSYSSMQRHNSQLGEPRISNSQSTMAMSTLMPSASMEPISEWGSGSNYTSTPNRSISEPDFGKTPRKVDSSKEANPSNRQENASVSENSSRFGRIGSQIFQKTFGLVLRSRPGRQAKLGEKNKFYYDEKLKRWVEEGAKAPPEETALPPPPTMAAFQSGTPDHNTKNAPAPNDNVHLNGGSEIKSRISSERSPGIPPIPSGSNQFSARGRMGVRSRYVDTFNKGGETSANLFQSPSIPAAKPGGGLNPKFFVPPPTTSSEETPSTEQSVQEAVKSNENTSASFKDDSFSAPSTSSSSSSMPMHRFPSMDNIVHQKGTVRGGDDSFHSHSRRTASWSGSISDANTNPSKMNNSTPYRRASSMSPPQFMPGGLPSSRLSMSGGSSSTEDLHEVEL